MSSIMIPVTTTPAVAISAFVIATFPIAIISVSQTMSSQFGTLGERVIEAVPHRDDSRHNSYDQNRGQKDPLRYQE